MAKIFKKQSMKSVAYFDEALTHIAAQRFAQDFNRANALARLTSPARLGIVLSN